MATFEDYDRFARQVERWPGVTIRERLNTGRSGHIIDFEMEFPDGAVAETDPARVDALEASAVIFDSPDRVKQWQLRLPQVPADGRGRGQMGHDIGVAITPPGEPDYMVTTADGRYSYTPHVAPHGRTVATRSPEKTLSKIQNIWSDYREWVDSEFRG